MMIFFVTESLFTFLSCFTRFYSLLYRKLLDPEYATSSSTGAFLNIVFKAMVQDTNVNRIRAFFRRLLQVRKILPLSSALERP